LSWRPAPRLFLFLLVSVLPALAAAGVRNLLSNDLLSNDPTKQDLLKSGRADDALRELQLRVRKNPADAEAWNLMGRVYFQLELWDDAIRAAAKSVELNPSSSEYHQWLGRAYGEKADASGSLSAFSLVRKVKNEFERAVALDTQAGNLSARSDLAEFYIEAPAIMGGDKSKAAALSQFVMKHDAALGHYIAARLAQEQKNTALAEQQYKAAVEAGGNAPEHWVHLASFYRRTGRLQEMESAVNRAAASPAQNGIGLFDGAAILLRGGRNFPAAIAMLRRYLALEDQSEDGPAFAARFLLGQLLEKQGDMQAAAGEYRAALALAPLYKKAQDALARVSR